MFDRLLPILTVAFILVSCTKGFGNKLTDPDVDIYFEFKEDEQIATELGRYWKSNGFTGNQHQSIRLTKDDEYFYVQLITKDKSGVTQIPFNELKLLMSLQQNLDSAILKGEKGCQIVICDDRFNPLVNINH